MSVERDFDAVLPHVDAVVLLRIQRERFVEMPLSDEHYVAAYRLDRRRLELVRKEAIVMHPGPYNRGMELDDCVLEFAGWRYARQVHHGVCGAHGRTRLARKRARRVALQCPDCSLQAAESSIRPPRWTPCATCAFATDASWRLANGWSPNNDELCSTQPVVSSRPD